MDVNVLTAGHINPDLSIEGQTQRFILGAPLLPEPTAAFKIDNIFVPVSGSPSFTNLALRNNVLSGYRWVHETQSTETYGSLRLQKFLYANANGIDLVIFNDNGTFSIPGLTDATYIIQTAATNLPNAQVLGSLATGILKNTTTTGVLSIAVNGTDYYSPGHPTTLIDDYISNANPTLSLGNVGVGTNALASLTLGSSSNTNNVAIGEHALYLFTTGSANTAVGHFSQYHLSAANGNATFGSASGYNLTTGGSNTFIGTGAGFTITTSSSNTFVGNSAGQSFDNFTSCLFLGASSGATVGSLTNAIAIGANSSVSASNTMVLGSSGITNLNIPGLNFGFTANTITSTNTNGNITVTPNGTGIISLSSNTGINTTSPTTAKLVVNGGVQNVTSEDSCIRVISSSNSAKIELNNTTASTGRLYEQRSNNDGTYGVFDRTSTAYRTFIDTNGYMGVGASSSLKGRVHTVNGPNNVTNESTGVCVETTNTNTAKLELRNSNTNGLLYEIVSNNQATGSGNGYFEIVDRTNSASRLRIVANGNVGINNTNPIFLFDVGGTIRGTRLLGNANAPTVSLGAAGQVGTGATFSITGSEVGGRFALNTGTGVLTTGTIATFTLASAMPSSSFSIIFYPAVGGIALNANPLGNNSFTISNTGLAVLTASTSYAWSFQIVGY